MTSSKNFDWNDVETDIAVPEQQAIAVYTNRKGAVIIRQQGLYGTSEDTWIYIHPQREAIVTLLWKIIEESGQPFEIVEHTERGYCDVPRPEALIEQTEAARPDIDWPAVHHDFDAGVDQIKKPKDSKGAKRQKRYRERKRNAETVTRNNEPKLVAAE